MGLAPARVFSGPGAAWLQGLTWRWRVDPSGPAACICSKDECLMGVCSLFAQHT